MKRGYIKLHRQIQECDIWTDPEPFDRRSAWIDLLLLANHEDKTTLFDGKPIVVMRGQRITSVRVLAQRWHWSNDKTLRYLNLLQSLGMIRKESNARRTLITIENYDKFQSFDDDSRTKSEQLPNSNRTVTERNNNDKNDKNNNKNTIRAFRKPTLEEVTAYCSERGNSIDPQSFIDYYDANGWKINRNPMKDWKATIRNWERRRGETVKKEEPDMWEQIMREVNEEHRG